MRTIFSMALAISAALAAGCATMKNDMVMNSMKHAVIVTGDAAATADCQKAREVEFYSGWGGFLMQEVGKRRVKAGMAELADQADANVVLVTKLEGGFWGANGNGIAFKCDEDRLQNIRQAPGSDTFAPE